MRRRIVCVLCALLLLNLGFLSLSDSVLKLGTNASLYYKLQSRVNVAESAGITEEDLYLLDERLALCLKGESNWNDDWSWNGSGKAFRVTVNGVEQDAFNAREIAHMQDCAELFAVLRAVRRVLIAVFALMCVALCLAGRKRQIECASSALVGIGVGTLIFCVPFAAFGVWTAIDFHSAFAFFHRCLFSNDLWLLNPETDLLIRICPSSMFASMGIYILLITAIPLLIAWIPVCAERLLLKRKKEQNEIADL